MRIWVRVKVNAKTARVVKLNTLDSDKAPQYAVEVKEPATEGRANRAVVLALAEFLGIASARVRIVAGQTARQKLVELL